MFFMVFSDISLTEQFHQQSMAKDVSLNHQFSGFFLNLITFKDGAYYLKICFPRCVIMQEMQILTSPIEIQKEIWG